MKLPQSHVHLLGIEGIGMSALARLLLQSGHAVSGSDLRLGSTSAALRSMGARLYAPHSRERVEALVMGDACLAVSSSIAYDNPEVLWARRRGIPIYHRAELLASFAAQKRSYGVSGSHGKTTTSALVVQLLSAGGVAPSFAVGGYINATKSNGEWREAGDMVIEIDESDGKSFDIPIDGGILTNFSQEHMDYWQSPTKLLEALKRWVGAMGNRELLIWCADDAHCTQIAAGRGWSYGECATAQYRLANLQSATSGLHFDLHLPGGGAFRDLQVPLQGRHNVLNASAAVALCHRLGIEEEVLRRGLAEFSGVARRCELRGTWRCEGKEIAVIDDYAHHPTEVRATLLGLRAAIGNRELIAIFQPHRYTRLRHCFADYTRAFDAADQVWICPVFAASEEPIAGFDSAALIAALRGRSSLSVQAWSPKLAQEHLVTRSAGDTVVCVMGAGDVVEVTALLTPARP